MQYVLAYTAALIDGVLSQTTPGTTKSGKPSKASHVLADGVAKRTAERAGGLLAQHPLYPGIDLG